MKVIKDARPEEVKQDAKHILFVEGSGSDPVDPFILRALLKDSTPITITPLGPSYHVKSVAEALYKEHPFYYFLIDRDHNTDSAINQCWRNFPDPNNNNLLIWKLREIENYFLNPDYLAKSKYLSVSKNKLESCLVKTCQSYIFFDIANQVITQVRESLKETWIKAFNTTTGFNSRETALKKLLKRKEFQEHEKKCVKNLKNTHIEVLFEKNFNEMTGGKSKLEIGSGKWLELIQGSRALPAIIGKCFQVEDVDGKNLQGPRKMQEVLKSLVSLDIKEQPSDFQKLHQLISEKIIAN